MSLMFQFERSGKTKEKKKKTRDTIQRLGFKVLLFRV